MLCCLLGHQLCLRHACLHDTCLLVFSFSSLSALSLPLPMRCLVMACTVGDLQQQCPCSVLLELVCGRLGCLSPRGVELRVRCCLYRVPQENVDMRRKCGRDCCLSARISNKLPSYRHKRTNSNSIQTAFILILISTLIISRWVASRVSELGTLQY